MSTRESLLVILVVAGLIAAVHVASIQSSGLVKCPPPGELEQLHIVVVPSGSGFVAQCMTVAAKGAGKKR